RESQLRPRARAYPRRGTAKRRTGSRGPAATPLARLDPRHESGLDEVCVLVVVGVVPRDPLAAEAVEVSERQIDPSFCPVLSVGAAESALDDHGVASFVDGDEGVVCVGPRVED